MLLIILSATSFLPASWFATPAWRQEFLSAGIPTGPLLSPQPWISLECAVLLMSGVLWIYWLAAQEWTAGERRWLATAFVAGAAVIAIASIITFYSGHPVPFWHSERGFGPFTNRNQTGDFFALGALLAVACANGAIREKKYSALWFILAAAILCAALVLSYSRAAVVIFFTGSLLWVASLGLVSRSVKSIALSASILMALAAAFLLFGGSTLERFQGGGGVTWGFRRLITRDVFSLLRDSPWCGIGLGNFEGVFALFRRESAMPSHIIHPESDWLWLWSEMGLPAVLTVLAGAAFLARRIFPLPRGTSRRLRLAAACGALVFALHGLVDVSGHRLGSAMPGLFLLGLALNNPTPRESRGARTTFRLIALIPGIAGAVWLCALLQGRPLPGKIGVEMETARAQALIPQGKYASAVDAATSALAWAPLDWQLYFIRGTAHAAQWHLRATSDDFLRTNLLESTSPLVTFDEGRIWMACAPMRAIAPWRETLRRSPPQDAGQAYAQMLDYASANPSLRRALHTLAAGRFDLELVYMAHADSGEVQGCIDNVLQSDPALRQLDDPQKTAFFRAWVDAGGGEEMVRRLAANPAWQPFAWRPAADYLASIGEPRWACIWAFCSIPQPALPQTLSGDTAEFRRRLLLRPDDFAAGYSLYAALMEKNDDTGRSAALRLLRDLTAQSSCPKYFFYLQARLEFRNSDVAAAWDDLQKYESPAGD